MRIGGAARFDPAENDVGRTTNGAGDHLAQIRAEEAAVATVDDGIGRLLSAGREALNNGGERGANEVSGAGIASSQGAWHLVVVLAVFLALDEVLTAALALLAPEITGSLGVSHAAYGNLLAVRAHAAVGVALRFGYILHRRPNRRAIAIGATLAAGIGTVLAAFGTNLGLLYVAVLLNCSVAGIAWVAHRPMLMDGYQTNVRVRVMSLHQAGLVVGAMAGPLAVGGLASLAGLSWRGVLLVIGLATTVASLLGLSVREPRLGHHDTDIVRAVVHPGDPAGDATHGEVALGFLETLRRVWLIPTMRRLLAAWAVVGITVTPFLTYMSFLLRDRWGLDLGARSIASASAWVIALPVVLLVGHRSDRLFRDDPSKLLKACTVMLLAVALGLLICASAPSVAVTVVGFGLVLAGSAALVAPLTVTTLSIVQPKARAVAGVLIAVFLVGVGGQGGALMLGGLDRRFGNTGAIALLAGPALVAAMLVWRAMANVHADLDHVIGEVIESEEIRGLVQRQARLPMLACRHIDFSYGQLQVLFGVDFTVDDGEVVALLGTNGAGKSTLLRVISGLGVPTRGSVRVRGVDITFVDAERRVGMGISQISGGHAVFGSLTVVENLRAFGYSQRRRRRSVEAGIDSAFGAFPTLAERRNQRACTLSGGQQQMLGLATALILRPRLLLIDELSLGLAPIVVGQLLETVKKVNEAGTAIVLIEQSVNIALSFVEHAYFMEKGEIRFDGRASDLIERPDLLRSVFLDGAAKGLGR